MNFKEDICDKMWNLAFFSPSIMQFNYIPMENSKQIRFTSVFVSKKVNIF